MRPFSLALCLARRGPHYCADCWRGGRSCAVLCFPTGSSSSWKTNVQTTQISITLSWEPLQEEGRPSTPFRQRRCPVSPPQFSCTAPAARAPAAAELPQPLTARPEHLAAWSLGLRGGAGRGGASARGAGRARARRRGGSARAAPKRAELGGASERQAEPGRLPAAQRPSCCVVGLRLSPTFAQAPAKLLFSWAPPGCLKESEHSAGSALPCSSGDLADVHPSPAGLSRSAPPHLLITPRSDEGAPAEGPRGRQRPRTLSLTAADLPRATLT